MANKFLALTVLTLFILKIFAINFTNFDLFGDEAQYWLWSRSLDYGYYSKPPLLAWVISVYTVFIGNSFIALKLLPSLIYFLIAWSVYKLCKNIGLGKDESITCSLIFLFIPAVSFSTFIISTDILLLLFWTLSLNELLKIKIYPELKKFVLLGIFLGLAFLSKYAAIYFLICLALYVVLDKDFRNLFVKNYYGFFISLICLFIILLPNIFWNFKNGWITLQHTSDNANFNNLDFSFVRGIEFLIIQIIMVGPLLFVGAITNIKKLKLVRESNFLLVFSIPIFIIVLIEAIIVRANANWAAPALVTFFIFLYLSLSNKFVKNLNIFLNIVFCTIFFILIGTSYPSKLFERINGINDFAFSVYSTNLGSGISNYVISDRLLFANMSYALRNKNLVFHMPHVPGSKISNHFKISSSLKKNFDENFILIGDPNEVNYLEKKHSLKKLDVSLQKFKKQNVNIYEVTFN